jgi:glycosyltransferase involved in cell wall biosynthesis
MGAVGLSLVTQISSRKIPMVLVIYDDWLVYAAGIDGWTRLFTKRGWARPLAEAIVRVPTTIDLKDAAVCFASDWLRRRAAERSPLDIGDRRGVVYGGIDLDLFNGGEGPRPWRNRLLVAGRIEQRKGVHVAIEALAQLPSDATLDILGPDDADDYVDGLHRRATELGLASRIDWVGPVPRARLAEAFRTTDVFVFPVVWDEPFGMVPLEAMACGAAVIATGTGGSNEFLHHEINCLRVEREDPAGIAAAVQRLASDEALRQAIVAAGRQTAQRFSDHRYYDELEEWHIAAADGFKAGTPKPRITDSR